jgi:hypothetical protein
MFARDQVDIASIHQQVELNNHGRPVPAPAAAVRHGQPRRFIDDATKTLTAPFRPLVAHNTSQWVVHAVPALLALILYGLMLGYAARYSRGLARTRPTHAPLA